MINIPSRQRSIHPIAAKLITKKTFQKWFFETIIRAYSWKMITNILQKQSFQRFFVINHFGQDGMVMVIRKSLFSYKRWQQDLATTFSKGGLANTLAI